MRLWHWAHHGRRHCDPWWENETEWHRAWKSQFPEDCREVVHLDEVTGEKHVADVKTRRGLVIELQHSAISPEELQSREKFYGHMIWIVDGRPFATQFEVRDSLPHPKSTLLEDVVFINGMYPHFWRKSENNHWNTAEKENSTGKLFVRIHPLEIIKNEIMIDYRGHHFFTWKKPRQVWMEATTPVFFDFSTNDLFRLMRYPGNNWCVQRISKQALVEKNGGTYSFIAKDN